MSFFSASEVTQKAPITSNIPKCGACGLLKTCKSPKMPVSGRGKLGILIVAEAPGEKEDDEGVQLVGKAGQLLRSTLWKFGVDLDRDCWKTNAIICRPPGNATPTNDQIDYCRPNVNKAIEELNPRMIIPLGGAAVRSIIGPLWKDDVGPVKTWVGWNIPSQFHNAWISPNYHPSYVLRSESEKEGPVVKVWFERYLEAALKMEGRPWVEIPDYESQIQIVYDPQRAADWLRNVAARGGALAIDYETDRLKPDAPDSEIVSCSVSWNGKETIAYPWVGDAISATSELLKSDTPKIGANNKFEDRWTRAKLGHPVNNWVWDCMLSGHHLDNRGGVSSVKFQGFVRLGVPPWDAGVKRFFEAPDSNSKNRIREVDLRTLLLYNGIDSLVEFLVAVKQKEEMRRGIAF